MDFLRTPWAKMESKNSFGTTKILPIFWDTRLLDPRLLEGILLSQWASGWILGMVHSRPTHAIPPDAAERNRVAQPSQRDVTHTATYNTVFSFSGWNIDCPGVIENHFYNIDLTYILLTSRYPSKFSYSIVYISSSRNSGLGWAGLHPAVEHQVEGGAGVPRRQDVRQLPPTDTQ